MIEYLFAFWIVILATIAIYYWSTYKDNHVNRNGMTRYEFLMHFVDFFIVSATLLAFASFMEYLH